MAFSQRDARSIAQKLNAEIKDGRKHPQVVVRYNGRFIGQFGIRHASKEKGHDYIPRQLHLSWQQARELVQCTIDRDKYFSILREKGVLLPSSDTTT